MADPPETRYVGVGEVSLACQVVGDGAVDVVFVPTLLSHVEHMWEHPLVARSLRRLAGIGRLITYDRRGVGLSDASPSSYGLADEVEDLVTLLDTVGAESPAVVTQLFGGPLSCLFAAMHPARVRSIVLHHCVARATYAEDYPWAPRPEDRLEGETTLLSRWGEGVRARGGAPSWSEDPASLAWLDRMERNAAGPRAAARAREYIGEMDVRAVLPAIRARTLVTRRLGGRLLDRRHAVYLAEHIPSARLLELPGDDMLAFAGDADDWIDAVGTFITGQPPEPPPERVLATLMFSDIVSSTEILARLGDRAWRGLLMQHDALARRELDRFGGRPINWLGDGFFARFEDPDAALPCALNLISAAKDIGLQLRVGIHHGECEAIGEDLAGLTVHEAAGISSAAGAGELLVSDAVRHVATSTGLVFQDRGQVTLKGLPDHYRLWLAREAETLPA